MVDTVIPLVVGGLCGLLAACVVLRFCYLSWKQQETPEEDDDVTKLHSKVIRLGAAARDIVAAEPPTLPTESHDSLQLGRPAAPTPPPVASEDTWDDGDPLTAVRTRPEHVNLNEMPGKVVLTSGAAVLIEDDQGRREWTCPRVHADVAPSIWIDVWGPLTPEDLVQFAQHYRKVERVQYEAPERLPTLLQELGYHDVGEWFRVYNTFLKEYGVGGPGDTVEDYAFGQDFKDALFAVDC